MRINGLDTEWWLDDVNAAALGAARRDPGAEGLESRPSGAPRRRAWSTSSADHSIRVWAMMETPLAILNARAIAAAAKDVETRLACFVMGTNDLAKETRARIVPGRAPMLPWLMTCVRGGARLRHRHLDGVYNDLADAEGFARECARGARPGLRRQDHHPPEPDRAVQRGVLAERRRRSRRRARSSRRSICRRTRARAWSRSTAAWSSGCMPTWRGARWRSRRRSRRAPRNA